MDPRDESLLQDLMDDRLDRAEADEVRRRLETESELKEAWDDLLRMQNLIRDDGGARAPRDFLTRVRQRIAVLPDDGDEITDPARPETARSFPSRSRWSWTTAISAAAAALLVALSVRFVFLGQTPEEGRSVESAQVDDELRETDEGSRVTDAAGAGDALRIRPADERKSEEEKGAGALGARMPRRGGVAGRSAPAGAVSVPADQAAPAPVEAPAASPPTGPLPAPSAVAPVPPVRVPSRGPQAPTAGSAPTVRARDGFHAGDAVPPGLREPSDEVAPPPEPAEALGRPKGAPAKEAEGAWKERGHRTIAGAPVYALEAGDLDEGRAEVAALLLALRAEDLRLLAALSETTAEARTDAGVTVVNGAKSKDAKQPSVRRSRLERTLDRDAELQDAREVLGTVVLELTPSEAKRLAQLGFAVENTRKRVARGGGARSAPPVPTTPAAPDPAPAPVVEPVPDPAASAPDAEPAAVVEEAVAKSDRSSARRISVRIVILKKP